MTIKPSENSAVRWTAAAFIYKEREHRWDMAEVGPSFDDSAAYERFMGPWSRAAGEKFLGWLAPPRHARWLDVGCGTGIFTGLVIDACAPSAVFAVDPAAPLIEHACRQAFAKRAEFRVADARSLPFADASFDILVSALVLNFIPDRLQALAEMRRVVRPGGVIAAYVWDFANERSPSGPFRSGLRRFGLDVPEIPGTGHSCLPGLVAEFERAGFLNLETQTIDVCLPFKDFDDFWHAQTSSHSPTTSIIAGLSPTQREHLTASVRRDLPPCSDGSIRYSARANAIKAMVSTDRT